MNGKPSEEEKRNMLRYIFENDYSVGPQEAHDLEKMYGFSPQTLVDTGHLENDPINESITITRKGISEIGEKPEIDTKLYRLLEAIQSHGGELDEGKLTDIEKEIGIIVPGAIANGYVYLDIQKDKHTLTKKGELIYSLGSESPEG